MAISYTMSYVLFVEMKMYSHMSRYVKICIKMYLFLYSRWVCWSVNVLESRITALIKCRMNHYSTPLGVKASNFFNQSTVHVKSLSWLATNKLWKLCIPGSLWGKSTSDTSFSIFFNSYWVCYRYPCRLVWYPYLRCLNEMKRHERLCIHALLYCEAMDILDRTAKNHCYWHQSE